MQDETEEKNNEGKWKSTSLTVEVSGTDALRLIAAFEAGELAHFGVVNIQVGEPSLQEKGEKWTDRKTSRDTTGRSGPT